jgi:hypothetical protein
MKGKILISYRLGDEPAFPGRLFDLLQAAFKSERLLLVMASIAPGLDFVPALEEQVAQCDVILTVIGKGWLDERNAIGRRLDNPDDPVRIVIEAALRQKKPVIPVLVGEAHMPRADELPEAIRPLARRHAVRLTNERFRADTQGLIRELHDVLFALAERQPRELLEEERRSREAELERKRFEAGRPGAENHLREEVDAALALKEAREAHRRREAEAEHERFEAKRLRVEELRLREEAAAKFGAAAPVGNCPDPTFPQSPPPPSSWSIAHPRRLSKGYSALFLVQFYAKAKRAGAKRRMSKLFGNQDISETITPSEDMSGRFIEIRLSSPEVDFSDIVRTRIETKGVHAIFLGKPKESSRPGRHLGLVTIKDADSGATYKSMPFEIRIVDYTFDHVSRPLLGNLASTAVGISSVASFIFTFLGQVDKTLGLASGTAGLFLAVFLTRLVSQLYRNPTITEVAKPSTV